jgi:predicted SAM-dependent methyltransferase
VRALIRSFKRVLGHDSLRPGRALARRKLPRRLSIASFEEDILRGIPRHDDRELFIKNYRVDPDTGEFIVKATLDAAEEETLLLILGSIENRRLERHQRLVVSGAQSYELVDKVHYGCGTNFFDGWLNVDLRDYTRIHKSYSKEDHRINYLQMNLTEKHGFPPNFFQFGYCEDFIEHLTQADSITFLAECSRTFRSGGVLRLSFPGLERVLRKHYRADGFLGAYEGKVEAFTAWDHLHFYSRDEISLVSQHVGFTNVEFVDYGNSAYPDLCHRDSREQQIGLNTYVELTK